MFIQHSLFQVLTRRFRLIIFAGLILAVATMIISLFFPLEYRADAQVLVISRATYGVDPYTVAKASELMGENLAQIMKSNDFFNKVMLQPGYNIDRERFTDVAERVKRKRWQKAVSASVVYGTGAVNISTYAKTAEQASQLAGAATSALTSGASEYVGGNVILKVINDPVATRFPVRPNIILNTFLGFILGVLAMSIGVLRKNGV